MNEQIIKQTEDLLKAAQNFKVPADINEAAAEGLAKSREAYETLSGVAKETGKAYEEAANVAQQGARVLTEKAIKNAEANTAAAFDAVEAVVKAKDVPSALRLQAELAQQAFATLSEQVREYSELAGIVAKDTTEAVNAAASKSLQPVKLG